MKTKHFSLKSVANFETTAKANKVNNVKTSTLLKSMAIAVLLCGASLNAQAQNDEYYKTKDEVAVTIGVGSNSQIFDAFSSVFSVMGEALVSSVVTGGTLVGSTSYENEKDIPAISVEYFHHLNPVISIGAIGAFSGTTSDMYCNIDWNNGNRTKEKVGTSSKYFITVMPAAKFDWLRKKNFGLYSKVAVGATYVTEKQKQDVNGDKKEVHSDNSVRFNFQASLIGVEVGSQKLRGFAELGVGEQGIALAGVRYKF